MSSSRSEFILFLIGAGILLAVLIMVLSRGQQIKKADVVMRNTVYEERYERENTR